MSWLESETAVIPCVSGAGQLGVTEDVDRLQKNPFVRHSRESGNRAPESKSGFPLSRE